MRRLVAILVLLAACASAPSRRVPDAAGLTKQEAAAWRAAAVALDAGDAATALEDVAPLLAREPWHVPSHALRQDALIALGRENEARSWYDAEAQRRPDDPARAVLAARVTPRDQGAREAAYRAAIERDPRSPWPRIGLAYELSRRARDEVKRATSLADEGFASEARTALAGAESVASEATRIASEVAEDRQDLAAAQGVLADVLLADPAFDAARAARALRAAESALALDPSAQAWRRVGRARRVNSQDELAAEAFVHATEAAPRDASGFAELGRVLLDLRKDAAAEKALGAAARLDPKDMTIAVNHAVALFRAGDLAAASEEFDRAARLAPTDPRPLDGLALARARLGDREGAAAAMERYLAAGGADRDAAKRFIEEMRAGPKP